MPDRVVITGAGLLSAMGLSAPETWDGLLEGRSAVSPIKGFDASGFSCGAAAEALDAGPEALGIKRREARTMDRHSYLLMGSVLEAYEEAGLGANRPAPAEVAFFAGMGMVDYRQEDLMPAALLCMDKRGRIDYDKFFSGAFEQIHPLWPLGMLNNIAFCQVSIRLGIMGDNTVFSPHADSGAQALWEAACSLSEGRSRVALASGVCEKVSPCSLARLQFSGVLAGGGENATCKPFAPDRDGTVPGEASATLVMELESSALARGSQPMAAITGFGAGFGTDEHDDHAPSREAYQTAMHKALSVAGCEASDVGLVIANADGTLMGDRNEARAISSVFGPPGGGPAVYATKGALGHTLAAAPVVDAAIALYIMRTGKLPGAVGAGPDAEALGIRLAVGAPASAPEGAVIINSSSPEGQTASIIMEAVG